VLRGAVVADEKNVVVQYIREPWRLAVPLKRLAIFLLFLGLAIAGYYWAIRNVRFGNNVIVSIIVFWLATAYYLLPRVHRLLSNIYLPNYFIGRARTVDGLLADPVNLALRGTKKQLVDAMHKAGWHEADPITFRTSWRTITSTLRRQSYPNAPVSDMLVFDRKQDLAFQKEVDGNPAKRHHVRFWRVDKDVYLPGGYNADWVAAATYDDAVGFSMFTLQITHSIDGDVDTERDYVVKTLQKAKKTKKVQRIEHFFPEYTHRNGGGHTYFTDGSMVIVDLEGKK
jgi:hypothetical protein